MDSLVVEAAREWAPRASSCRALSRRTTIDHVGEFSVRPVRDGRSGALAADAQAGLQIFRGKGNCTACHVGPTFSDERFHNTGIAWVAGGAGVEAPLDEGRAGVTGRPADRGAFKTPTLREIDRTAPYMHDGSIASLGEVVEYYDRGGNKNPTLDPEVRPFALTPSDKQALVAFLRSLSGEVMK